MRRVGPRQLPTSTDPVRRSCASEQGEGSPTRELIVRLETQVTALTGAVRGLEERLPASLVDIQGAADYLCVSIRTVRRMVARREIPYRRVGKVLRFDLTDLRPPKAA